MFCRRCISTYSNYVFKHVFPRSCYRSKHSTKVLQFDMKTLINNPTNQTIKKKSVQHISKRNSKNVSSLFQPVNVQLPKDNHGGVNVGEELTGSLAKGTIS